MQPVLGFTAKKYIFRKGKQTALRKLPTERYFVLMVIDRENFLHAGHANGVSIFGWGVRATGNG